MLKGYKYLLKPTKEQELLLKNHMFSVSQAYNIILSIKKEEYELNKIRKLNNEKVQYFSSKYIDDKVKDIITQRKLVKNTKTLQQERTRFTQNSKSQIKKIKNGNKDIGNLKYKKYSHTSRQSFQTTKEQYSLKDCDNPRYKILKLFRNDIKIVWSRDLPSEPTSITISFEAGQFFIVFNVIEPSIIEVNGLTIEQKKQNHVGLDINNSSLDLGTETFHKKINISQLKNRKFLEQKIIKLQKRQSKRLEVLKSQNKVKLGSNYYKTQIKINKINKTLRNKRNYRLHDLTNNILKTIFSNGFNSVVVEDLNVKNMTVKTTNKNKIKLLGKEKTKTMKKNILDISYSELLRILEYKCVQFGIIFSKVNPKYTSKTCSSCGTVHNELELKYRVLTCNQCGFELNRDHNAAINIKNRLIA